MKAILIDPFALVNRDGIPFINDEVVREVDIDLSDTLKSIYRALSYPEHEVNLVDVVRISDNGDVIFVDDERLLHPRDHWFLWANYPQPIAGRGLIIGLDDEGDSISPIITLEEARQKVRGGMHNASADPSTKTITVLPNHFAVFYQHGFRET